MPNVVEAVSRQGLRCISVPRQLAQSELCAFIGLLKKCSGTKRTRGVLETVRLPSLPVAVPEFKKILLNSITHVSSLDGTSGYVFFWGHSKMDSAVLLVSV